MPAPALATARGLHAAIAATMPTTTEKPGLDYANQAYEALKKL